MLAWGRQLRSGVNLGVRDTYADLSATVLDFLGVDGRLCGTSFLREIKK